MAMIIEKLETYGMEGSEQCWFAIYYTKCIGSFKVVTKCLRNPLLTNDAIWTPNFGVIAWTDQ